MLLKKPSFKYELDINKFINEEEIGIVALFVKSRKKNQKNFMHPKYLDLEINEEKKYIYCEIKIMVSVNHPTFTKYFGMKNNCRFLFEYEERGSLFKILEQINKMVKL